jgi:aryl-alcohol dehydrogenase-like predicted oxidoreductase
VCLDSPKLSTDKISYVKYIIIYDPIYDFGGAVDGETLETFTARLLELASGFEVVSNQVSFSLLDRRAAGDLAALCGERGVRLLAYGTVAGGMLTERWLEASERPASEMQTWSQMKYRRFIAAMLSAWKADRRRVS